MIVVGAVQHGNGRGQASYLLRVVTADDYADDSGARGPADIPDRGFIGAQHQHHLRVRRVDGDIDLRRLVARIVDLYAQRFAAVLTGSQYQDIGRNRRRERACRRRQPFAGKCKVLEILRRRRCYRARHGEGKQESFERIHISFGNFERGPGIGAPCLAKPASICACRDRLRWQHIRLLHSIMMKQASLS